MSTRNRLDSIIDRMNEQQMQALILILEGTQAHKDSAKASADELAGSLTQYADLNKPPYDGNAWADAAVKRYENT